VSKLLGGVFMVRNMTEGDPLKLILPFMVPLLIGNVFQQLYNIADIIIVGRTIGVNALAAVGAIAPLFMMLVVLTMGLLNGFTVVTGQRYGAGDLDGVRRSVAMSTTLSLFFVLLLMLVATFALDPALAAMNVPEELFADAKSYVLIISHGIIAMMGYNLLAGILRSLGDSKTPLYFLIIATILNIFLALLFIIQFGWGVPGSAVALVIAQGFSALLCIVYIAKRFPLLRLRKQDWRLDWDFAWEHLRMGLPMAVQFSVSGLGMIFIQAVCNKFGPTTIAAFTSAMRIEQLALQPMISFGLSMAVFSAQNFGAHRFDRIREGVKKCSLLALCFSLFAAIIMYFFGREMISIFISEVNEQVLAQAQQYLHLSVPFYFFLSQIFIYRNTVQGMGIAMIPMFGGIVELILRTLVAVYLTEYFGYSGICYASPIAWLGSSLLMFASYHYFIRLLENSYERHISAKN
ncbi:MAG: MATE family efflux transporter, partial [Acidaminococcaceae bacterium]|nr:MATE family efflux transporter [Acidaminococcaceae bacterium]